MTPSSMTPSSLIYHAVARETNRRTGLACCVCGSDGGASPRKKIIKHSFTNIDMFASPQSEMVCEACAFVIGNPQFRRTSFFCNYSEFIPLKREDLSDPLLQRKPKGPYIFVVTTSYKKHLWLSATVCQSEMIIRFDENNLPIHRDRDRKLLDAIELFYSHFTKAEIINGDYQSHKMIKVNLHIFETNERIIAPHRGSERLKLMMFIANKKEELCKKLLKPEPQTTFTKANSTSQKQDKQLLIF